MRWRKRSRSACWTRAVPRSTASSSHCSPWTSSGSSPGIDTRPTSPDGRTSQRLDVPLVILIGGATGVGKSTIATHLAHRLGHRARRRHGRLDPRGDAVDALAELMPTLHVSSFQADTVVREPRRGRSDALVAGFREQTAAVSVGIKALIKRAAAEGTSIVIEGVHVVPGFFDLEVRGERIVPFPWSSRWTRKSRHRSISPPGETGVASGRALRAELREHPEAPALRQEPGAVPRRAGRAELRLRSVDLGRARPGDGACDRAAAAGAEPPARRARTTRGGQA